MIPGNEYNLSETSYKLVTIEKNLVYSAVKLLYAFYSLQKGRLLVKIALGHLAKQCYFIISRVKMLF